MEKKKKLAIIGTVGVPAIYGGFETLAENLLDLFPRHYGVTVFCESNAYPQKLQQYKNARLVYLNLRANGIQSILYDIWSILKTFRKYDYLLILGVSGTVILPLIRPFLKGLIFTNIDGFEWKRVKWNFLAKKYLKFSEWCAVHYSDYIISDNMHIQEYVMNEYHKPSFLIAYGGDHVVKVGKLTYLEKYPFLKDKYLITVCRIEPENNIELLIQGYLYSSCPHPYIFVGNWQSGQYGKQLYQKYKSAENLYLFDPIYEAKELNALRSNCFFYLHGHSAGGTNPSLVEAMYLGLPIICYDASFNRATTFNKAIYFSDREELAEILGKIGDLDREGAASGMIHLARDNYKWSLISLQYVEAINQIERDVKMVPPKSRRSRIINISRRLTNLSSTQLKRERGTNP